MKVEAKDNRVWWILVLTIMVTALDFWWFFRNTTSNKAMERFSKVQTQLVEQFNASMQSCKNGIDTVNVDTVDLGYTGSSSDHRFNALKFQVKCTEPSTPTPVQQ